ISVAPHAGCAARQRLPRKTALHQREVIANVQNAAIFRTDVSWLVSAQTLAALGAFEICDSGHERSLAFHCVGRAPFDKLRASSRPPWVSAPDLALFTTPA